MLLLRTVLIGLVLVGPVGGEPLTLPQEQRPHWLQQDGIVMAGSWEPLLFRVRRDGSEVTQLTDDSNDNLAPCWRPGL